MKAELKGSIGRNQKNEKKVAGRVASECVV